MTNAAIVNNESNVKNKHEPFTNLVELFDRSAQRFADLPCLDFMGKGMLYREVAHEVDRLAAGLQALGVGPGVHVGICFPNTPYSVITYFAVLKAGGVVVNFNPLYAPAELKYQITDSNIKLMLTLDLKMIMDKLTPCLESTELEQIIVFSMAETLPPLKSILFKLVKGKELAKVPKVNNIKLASEVLAMAGSLSSHPISPDQLAVLQYTGGTTGTPKGAMLSHYNLANNINQAMIWMDNVRFGQERLLCILPFFHVFAMTVLMNLGLSIGGKLYLMPRFELKQALKALHKHKITTFPAVPSLYNAIVNAPDLSKYDLSNLKYCLSGGAPLPISLRHEFKAKTGGSIVEGYGLSETSPILTAHPIDGRYRDGSIGLPLRDTEISIRDPEDHTKVMQTGWRGEVCAKGPQVMKGYWKKEEETKKVMKDGWFHTGDIGIMDEDGFIFIVDRIKDMILVNGYNVYPRNIEEALYKHPGVQEVIVIGVYDKDRGQSPKAFVKKADSHPNLQEQELLEFLKEHISAIEMPRQIEFRDVLPKTMIGKLSKKELVEEEQKRLAAG